MNDGLAQTTDEEEKSVDSTNAFRSVSSASEPSLSGALGNIHHRRRWWPFALLISAYPRIDTNAYFNHIWCSPAVTIASTATKFSQVAQHPDSHTSRLSDPQHRHANTSNWPRVFSILGRCWSSRIDTNTLTIFQPPLDVPSRNHGLHRDEIHTSCSAPPTRTHQDSQIPTTYTLTTRTGLGFSPFWALFGVFNHLWSSPVITIASTATKFRPVVQHLFSVLSLSLSVSPPSPSLLPLAQTRTFSLSLSLSLSLSRLPLSLSLSVCVCVCLHLPAPFSLSFFLSPSPTHTHTHIHTYTHFRGKRGRGGRQREKEREQRRGAEQLV
jgi:hypothetical protein